MVVLLIEALVELLEDGLVASLTLGPRLHRCLHLVCSLLLPRNYMISLPSRIGIIGRVEKRRAGVLIRIDSWPLMSHPLTPDN